jgi:hypothetical protein
VVVWIGTTGKGGIVRLAVGGVPVGDENADHLATGRLVVGGVVGNPPKTDFGIGPQITGVPQIPTPLNSRGSMVMV